MDTNMARVWRFGHHECTVTCMCYVLRTGCFNVLPQAASRDCSHDAACQTDSYRGALLVVSTARRLLSQWRLPMRPLAPGLFRACWCSMPTPDMFCLLHRVHTGLMCRVILSCRSVLSYAGPRGLSLPPLRVEICSQKANIKLAFHSSNAGSRFGWRLTLCLSSSLCGSTALETSACVMPSSSHMHGSCRVFIDAKHVSIAAQLVWPCPHIGLRMCRDAWPSLGNVCNNRRRMAPHVARDACCRLR